MRLIELKGSSKSRRGRVIKLSLESLLIQLVVDSVILTAALTIMGKRFVGRDKVKFTDALWIGILGVILSTIIGLFLSGWVTTLGSLIMILVLLALIKHLFDCSWREGLVLSLSLWMIYWVMILILVPPTLW
jgi:hypothetical protein